MASPQEADSMQSLMQENPALFVEMIIRVIIATILVMNIDAFLKAVVTPILVATGIGVVVAPVTFFMGQALQPIINSICFFHFDDRFVMASLASTGVKDRLVKGMGLIKWHKMGLGEKILMRYSLKVSVGSFVGLTSILAYIPLLGPVLLALISGWAVAWDLVYIPLSGIGYTGIVRQARTVYANFGKFYWFGFWAVLMEEMPIVGPMCHVYNVYRAPAFLEMVYLSNSTGFDGGLESLKEL
eukprot:866316_1